MRNILEVEASYFSTIRSVLKSVFAFLPSCTQLLYWVCGTAGGLRGADNLRLQPTKWWALVNGRDTNFRSTLPPSPLVFVMMLWWFTPAAATQSVSADSSECQQSRYLAPHRNLSSDTCKLVWSSLAGMLWSFKFSFPLPHFSCQSPTSIKHGNQPLQGRALPQTRTQTRQRPLLAKCRYIHYQTSPKTYIFFVLTSTQYFLTFFFATVVHLIAHSSTSQAPFMSLCESLWFFLCVCSATSQTVWSSYNQNPL